MTSRKFDHFLPLPTPLVTNCHKILPPTPPVTSHLKTIIFVSFFLSAIFRYFCSLLLSVLHLLDYFSSVDPMQHCILFARHPYFVRERLPRSSIKRFVQLVFVHHYTKTNTGTFAFSATMLFIFL